jgi:hypothetical protein
MSLLAAACDAEKLSGQKVLEPEAVNSCVMNRPQNFNHKRGRSETERNNLAAIPVVAHRLNA